MKGGTGKVGDDPSRKDAIDFWNSQFYEAKPQAIFDIKKFHHEVLKPGTGSQRLDRSIGGTRSLRDGASFRAKDV
jgi:hypothetical protein